MKCSQEELRTNEETEAQVSLQGRCQPQNKLEAERDAYKEKMDEL
jgi:hypothetical protein